MSFIESWPFIGLLGFMIGIAIAVWAIIMLLVYAGSAQRAKRYRPGRPFTFTPVWFLAAPERRVAAAATGRHALTSGTSSVTTEPGEVSQGETGGASDRW